MVDSPFIDSPLIFIQGGTNFGEELPENLRKMGKNRDIYSYANQGVVNFEREYYSLPPGTNILVMPQLSNMRDQILEKNEKKKNNSIFRPKFHLRVLTSQNIRIYPKIFHMTKQTSYVIDYE